MYVPFNKSEEQVNDLVDVVNQDRTKLTYLTFENSAAYKMEEANRLVNGFSEVFMYMGIVLAVFAVLLLSNFIASSISAKTRDIGILRALGATSGDVFKIFFFESFIISVSCILLSIVGSFILSGVLNKVVCGELGVNIFVFGITSMLMLIVLALFTTIIATFIPVRNAAKKKPVESIRVS